MIRCAFLALLVLSLGACSSDSDGPTGPSTDPPNQPDFPAIQLSVQSLSFAGIGGGEDPSPRTVSIDNSGRETLSGLVVDVSYAGADGWLSTVLSSGTAPATLEVAPDMDGVPAGFHTATVTVSAPGADNSPQTVQVELDAPYAMIGLGTLGGEASEALDINESGQIVGWSFLPSGDWHAVLWDNGEIVDLGTLGGRDSEARGINNLGQVVGWSRTAEGPSHAFLWQDGVMTDLGTLGGFESWAWDINDAGQVAGFSGTEADAFHAFLWEDGVMTDLDPLGDTDSEAMDINGSGQIVGIRQSSLGQCSGFLWHDGSTTDLRTLEAVGINEAGHVVGWSIERGSLLWIAGVATELGDISPYAVNGDDTVVGNCDFVACVWADGAITNLDGILGYGINDAGQVVGVASWPDSGSDWEATLWQPAP